MAARFPASAPKKRSVKKRKPLRQWLVITLRFFLSPLVILGDSFRRRGIIDRTWLFCFFLFLTVLMSLTGIGIFIIDDPLSKTLRMMTNLTENREVLAGDFQPIVRAINRYSFKYNVDPNLIYAIIKSESSFRPQAVSPSGAKGLMQLMPEVWCKFSNSHCDGLHSRFRICHDKNCIFDPEANIRVGTRYFRSLLNNYQDRVDLALEAYNAGITNVQPGESPKFEETRGYIDKTIDYWQELRKSALNQQLKIAMRLQNGLKWLFGMALLCWLVFFWWASQKLFSK